MISYTLYANQIKLNRKKVSFGDIVYEVPSEEDADKLNIYLFKGQGSIEDIEISPKDEWIDGLIVSYTSTDYIERIYEAGEEAFSNSMSELTTQDAIEAMYAVISEGRSELTVDDTISCYASIPQWSKIKNKNFEVKDTCTANNQIWECFQAHKLSEHPDITPDNPAWFTFWKPLHGKTLKTARPFTPVQGAHDMYEVGEYAIFKLKYYKCKRKTNFSPEDNASDWEEVKSVIE